MLLRGYIFRLALQKTIAEQLFLDIFKTQPDDSICEAFPSDTLFTEQKDRLFHHIQDFRFIGKHFSKILPSGNLFTPASADINAIAVGIIDKSFERTFAYAAAAMIADLPAELQSSCPATEVA